MNFIVLTYQGETVLVNARSIKAITHTGPLGTTLINIGTEQHVICEESPEKIISILLKIDDMDIHRAR